ncbi:hypothetical protein NHX12_001181 [Muraenolepis orangiensis]|uniref:rhomboid protease n=1 Tax=Muraenolepis orangiensis TaxID=630683 RepID=A0A9Q0DXX4_9TELE|nr:hypothetical protein NHX12_001181 [Muraenolepis orangiensis]
MLGTCEVTLQVGDYSTRHPVWVATVGECCLLGLDFLRKGEARLDLLSGTMELKDDKAISLSYELMEATGKHCDPAGAFPECLEAATVKSAQIKQNCREDDESRALTAIYHVLENSQGDLEPEQRRSYAISYSSSAIALLLLQVMVEHILGNLLMQLILGIPLELVHKGFEVGMVYMAGVLAGSLASSIFDPHSALVGASGGVYALLGGYFMNTVVNFREMIRSLALFRIFAILAYVGPCPNSLLSVVIIMISGWNAMPRPYTNTATNHNNVCFRGNDQKLLKDPRFWMCIAGYVIFMIAAVLFNVFL